MQASNSTTGTHDMTEENPSNPDMALPPYISPTLGSMPVAARPQRSTVCQVCPASLWFASEGGLQAYCKVMHSITWSNQEPNALTHCDGQVQAEQERQRNAAP